MDVCRNKIVIWKLEADGSKDSRTWMIRWAMLSLSVIFLLMFELISFHWFYDYCQIDSIKLQQEKNKSLRCEEWLDRRTKNTKSVQCLPYYWYSKNFFDLNFYIDLSFQYVHFTDPLNEVKSKIHCTVINEFINFSYTTSLSLRVLTLHPLMAITMHWQCITLYLILSWKRRLFKQEFFLSFSSIFWRRK